MPSAPDCEDMAMLPGSGYTGENEPFMLTAALVLMTPRQLGPIMRMPARRTIDRSSFSRALPSGPVSEKPALMTTMPRTPFSTHCWTTSSTMAAGTTM